MMQPTDSALLFADRALAQARSQQLSSAMGGNATHTPYWHECITLTNGQAALIVKVGGKYGTKPGPTAQSQLTPAEIAALQSYSVVKPLLPVVTGPIVGT